MAENLPDWKLVEVNYKKIARAQPEYYPALCNYAVSLQRRGRKDEAESIIRTVVEKYPEYLFARSALSAHEIAPDLTGVKMMWNRLKDWSE